MNWLTKISDTGTVVAYHATNNGTYLLEHGFTDPGQLPRTGLGGGRGIGTSFTISWDIAKSIFDGFIMMFELAHAPDRIQAINESFNSVDPKMAEDIEKSWKTVVGGDIRDALAGRKMSPYGSGMKTPDELLSMGFTPNEEAYLEETNKYYQWYEPLTPQDISHIVYSYVKIFLSTHPDKQNPVFFGSDLEHFEAATREDIGILTVELNIDPSQRSERFKDGYDFLVGEGEYRIKDMGMIGSILNYDTNPGDSPSIQTLQNFYHLDDVVEQHANNIVRALMKARTIVESLENVNADMVINIIHSSTDMNDLKIKVGKLLSAMDLPANSMSMQTLIKSLDEVKESIAGLRADNQIKKAISFMPEKIRNEYGKLETRHHYDDFQERWYDADPEGNSKWYDDVLNAGIGNVDAELSYWIDDRQYLHGKIARLFDDYLKYVFPNIDIDNFNKYYDLVKSMYDALVA